MDDVVSVTEEEKYRIRSIRDKSPNELKIWFYRLEHFSYNLKDAKGAFLADRQALSVIAALIMTIGFAGLVLSPASFEISGLSGALQYIIPFLWAFTAFTSMLCVWSSSCESTTLLHLKEEDYINYLEKVVSICVTPFFYMKCSMFTLVLAASVQVISLDSMQYPGLMVLGMAIITLMIGQRHEYKVFTRGESIRYETPPVTWWDLLYPIKWLDIIYWGIDHAATRDGDDKSDQRLPASNPIQKPLLS